MQTVYGSIVFTGDIYIFCLQKAVSQENVVHIICVVYTETYELWSIASIKYFMICNRRITSTLTRKLSLAQSIHLFDLGEKWWHETNKKYLSSTRNEWFINDKHLCILVYSCFGCALHSKTEYSKIRITRNESQSMATCRSASSITVEPDETLKANNIFRFCFSSNFDERRRTEQKCYMWRDLTQLAFICLFNLHT